MVARETVARKTVAWKDVARFLVPFFGIVVTAAGQSSDFALYAQDLRAADVLLAQGEFEGVIQKLESWPERLPDRPEARHFLGLAHYRLRNFEAAIRHLSAALDREKQGSPAWKQTVEILGGAYYFESEWQDAEPLLEKAAGWRPEDSELSYSLAMTHLHMGHRDQARIAFAKIFEVDPEAPQAFALTAELMLRENRSKDAELLIVEALEKQPGLPGAAYKLGVIAFRQGDYGRASELLRKELARDPNNAAAWHSLGETLSALGKQAEAAEALKRAIWLNTRLSESYVLLAKIYADQQRLELAEDTVRRAIQVDPQSYEAHFLQSRIYYKRGRVELAKKELAIAEELRRSAKQ